jgi:hypothetical protein
MAKSDGPVLSEHEVFFVFTFTGQEIVFNEDQVRSWSRHGADGDHRLPALLIGVAGLIVLARRSMRPLWITSGFSATC